LRGGGLEPPCTAVVDWIIVSNNPQLPLNPINERRDKC